MIADAGHRAGDGDFLEAMAAVERILSDRRDAVVQDDAFHIIAVIEHPETQGCYAFEITKFIK